MTRRQAPKRYRRRTGQAEAAVTVKEGRGRTALVESAQEAHTLPARRGAALVRVGVGITRSENFQSVRADVAVELPSQTDPESLKQTARDCRRIGTDFMNEVIAELQETLRGRGRTNGGGQTAGTQAAPVPAAAGRRSLRSEDEPEYGR